MDKKFSHFIDQDGNKVKKAMFDGYHIGEQLLEDVKFLVAIQEDGSLKVEVEESAKEYLSQFNEKQWLDKALNFAKTYDLFEDFNGEDIEWNLVMEDGKFNFEK